MVYGGRINDIPHCVMVMALIGIGSCHGVDEIGIDKIVVQKCNAIIIFALGVHVRWEWGGQLVRLL